MTTGRRFVTNAFSLMGSQVLIASFSFVLVIFMARYLGAEDYGKYSFASTLIGFFAPVAALGLNQVVIREVSRKREEKDSYLGTSILLKLVSSFIMFTIASLVTFFTLLPEDTKIVIFLFGFAMIIKNVQASYGCIYSAFERLDIIAAIQIIERIISFGFILALLFLGYNLIAISIVQPVTSILILILNILIGQKLFHSLKTRFVPKLGKYLLANSWPFVVDIFFMTTYLKLDILMLQAMKGSSYVGYYSVATTFMFLFMIIPASFVDSIYPVFSRMFIEKKELFSFYFEKLAKILLTIALCSSIIVTIGVYKLIPFLYGHNYFSSIGALQILIWTLPFIFLASLSRIALQSANLQRIPMWIAGGNIGVNLILNSVLIPRFGINGAACATVITEIIGLILLLLFIKKKIGIKLKTVIGFPSKRDILLFKELLLNKRNQKDGMHIL